MTWFVNDPEGDGYNEYDTEEEAKQMAERCLQYWRDAAEDDGEWDDAAVLSLKWGKVHEKARLVSDGNPTNPSWDAVLKSA